MWSDFEHRAMERAVAEAKRGRPSPNPRVGAVIVRDGKIVSVGHHEKAGEAHAEVDAIRNAGGSVQGATLYVTLEPCNHQGRTGPCTEAILDAGIARVVLGCRDPAPHVAGAIDRLSDAGVEVEAGLMELECTALVADFAKHIRTGLPFVTLKAAVTLDGKIATRTGA
jgi:diaminohydroxyphosphoribosylaminopyrimidine deaminase/5-amino-6-(5-phosphoribosylamino)uracil reductase